MGRREICENDEEQHGAHMLGSLMKVKNAKTTKYYRNRLLVCCRVRCRLPPPSAKQTSPKCRGHLRAATRCYARPWFPTADLSKISFLVSRSSLGIRGANTSITSTNIPNIISTLAVFPMPLTTRSVHNHQLLPHIFHISPQNIAKLQPPCATGYA